jgi:hypothetical protein
MSPSSRVGHRPGLLYRLALKLVKPGSEARGFRPKFSMNRQDAPVRQEFLRFFAPLRRQSSQAGEPVHDAGSHAA